MDSSDHRRNPYDHGYMGGKEPPKLVKLSAMGQTYRPADITKHLYTGTYNGLPMGSLFDVAKGKDSFDNFDRQEVFHMTYRDHGAGETRQRDIKAPSLEIATVKAYNFLRGYFLDGDTVRTGAIWTSKHGSRVELINVEFGPAPRPYSVTSL